MSKARISDLARELEVKSRAILNALKRVGVPGAKTHSSSIEAEEAERVRHYIKGRRQSTVTTSRNRVKKPCPECGQPIIHMDRHLRKVHPVAFDQFIRKGTRLGTKRDYTADAVKNPQSTDAAPARRPCPKCGKLLTQIALDLHAEGCLTRMQDIGSHLAGMELPFEILPPGPFDFRTHLERKAKIARSSSRLGPLYKWVRLHEIEKIDGKMTHCGKKAWLGYCVYEFPNSRQVVLESPVKGNATYVLSSEWKNMIHLHKAEIRNEYRGKYVRVLHTGDWLRRVDHAVRKGRMGT
jgi:predicted RNA-binding Zn-ribbon protein involved in translation (DUF1610 family)